MLEEAEAQLLPGQARVRLDDDEVRVEVGDELLRPATVLAAGAEAVQVAADAGLEVQTVSSPGMLVQTRPLARSPTGWSMCPAAPGRRCTCASRPTGRC